MTHPSAENLYNLLQSLTPIPESEWQWLAARLDNKKYKPDDALFSAGQFDASIHFLECGLVRYYYLTEDGQERNHTFASEGNLVACLPSFAGISPCTFTVESLEPTSTLVIPADVFQEPIQHHRCWSELKMRLLGHVALRKEAREAEFLLNSAEARYRHFLTKYKFIASRIPQFHIASYLGITPVGLSRIRKRINLG